MARYVLFAAIAAAFSLSMSATGTAAAPAEAGKQPVSLAEKLAILKDAYSDTIFAITNNTLRTMRNSTMVIDDHNKKDHRARQRRADIEDSIAQIYPVGKCYKGRKRNQDPGRGRSEAFLRELYGDNVHKVDRDTATLDWFGTPVTFSRRHGAHDALLRVRDDISALPANYQNAVRNPRLSFEWRTEPASDRLSVYSFAVALKLKAEISKRWRNRRSRFGRVRGYRNKVPAEIVAAFERHGFIWGGKWHRFDTATSNTARN